MLTINPRFFLIYFNEELYKKIISEGLAKAKIISRKTLELAKKAAGLI